MAYDKRRVPESLRSIVPTLISSHNTPGAFSDRFPGQFGGYPVGTAPSCALWWLGMEIDCMFEDKWMRLFNPSILKSSEHKRQPSEKLLQVRA